MAHFDRDGIVDPYVLHYLRAVRAVAQRVLFVSASGVPAGQVAEVRALADELITRENRGYDFGSWRAGVEAAGDLEAFDELILCNDSVYAPLFPLGRVLDRMEGCPCDFWGLTDNGELQPHLQSYFLAFRRRAFTSEAFRRFIAGVTEQPSREDYIRCYELGLSRELLAAGLRAGTYYRLPWSLVWSLGGSTPGRRLRRFSRALLPGGLERLRRSVKVNKTLYLWRELIGAGCPTLKIELIRGAPPGAPAFDDAEEVLRRVERETDYPVALIRDHIARTGRRRPPPGGAPSNGP